MPLTDIAIRKMQHSGSAGGDKHSDALGMYLLVKAAGKYWRLGYRFGGKQKTLALGVYPEVSLAAARAARTEARALLAQGIDPAAARQEAKRAPAPVDEHTFGSVAEEFFAKDAKTIKPKTIQKHRGWLDNDILPMIGGRVTCWRSRSAPKSAARSRQRTGYCSTAAASAATPSPPPSSRSTSRAACAAPWSGPWSSTTQRSRTRAGSASCCARSTPTRGSIWSSAPCGWRRWCSCALVSCAPLNGPSSTLTPPNGGSPGRR